MLRRVGGQGIYSAGRENWLGLRVAGDQSHPVRPSLRTEIFTHAKVAKGLGIQGVTGEQSHPVRIVMQKDTTKKLCRDSFVTGFELFGYVDTNTAIILTAARKIGLEQI